ncbi:ATP/GTP-binding protein [Paenarthrobacter sp. YIM B13468]|uniref:ATP/GTP-binding protein n=1 Tax=Paenarthrobacter sp. YIM B13468 TaxID=3366295 RepID=UPI003671DAF8
MSTMEEEMLGLPRAQSRKLWRKNTSRRKTEALALEAAKDSKSRKRPVSKSAAKKAEKKEARERELIESKATAATRWHHERKWGFASKLGFYDPAAPGVPSSTRQMEFSHMAIASPPTSHRGLVFGVDAGSGWMIVHDPFTAYGDTIESPNVCVIGDLGQGKSSAMKTWGVLRQLVLGRRVVVIDKKYQKDVSGGEYTPLARKLEVAPVQFRIGGGGSRINILDPRIAARVNEEAGEGDQSTPAGQSMLLRAVMEEALRRPMTPKEGKAVRMAHRQALAAAKADGEVAHIGHVLKALYTPDEAAATATGLTSDELREWGQDPAFELERMIEDDLAGLIDGETSADIQLNAGLTVFDVSLLPEDGPALPIVMTIINTWLANTLYRQEHAVPTVLLIEEAWHTVQGSVATVTRRNTKLSRALSLSCQFAFHHISDIPADSPAISMLKECGTVLLYKQQKSADALACEEMFTLPAGTAEVITKLVKGTCLFKIDQYDPFEAIHVRSPLEVELTDTDGAMKSTSTIGVTEQPSTTTMEDVPA